MVRRCRVRVATGERTPLPRAGQRPNAGTARGVGASTHMRPVRARVMAASTAIAELLSHSVRDDCDTNHEGDGNASGNDPTQSIARKFGHLEQKYGWKCRADVDDPCPSDQCFAVCYAYGFPHSLARLKEKAGSEGEFRPGCTHVNVHYGELAGGGESFGCTRIGRYSGSRLPSI